MENDTGQHAAEKHEADHCEHFDRTRANAAHLTVGDVMVRRPKSLHAGATVGDVRRMFGGHKLLNVVLLEGRSFAGLVELDAVAADVPDTAPARNFAVTDVPTVSAQTPVPAALTQMDDAGLSRLVVLDDDGVTVAGLVCLDHTGDGFCGG